MTMNPDERQRKIKKLPQWVQEYISRLEGRLEKEVTHYRKLLTETEAGQTSVSWTDYINEKHLPDKGVIRWQLPNGSKIEVNLKDDRLEVRNSEAFNSTLVILPAYSNVFYVTILKHTQEDSESIEARRALEEVSDG